MMSALRLPASLRADAADPPLDMLVPDLMASQSTARPCLDTPISVW
jgi:hypothetical protein